MKIPKYILHSMMIFQNLNINAHKHYMNVINWMEKNGINVEEENIDNLLSIWSNPSDNYNYNGLVNYIKKSKRKNRGK